MNATISFFALFFLLLPVSVSSRDHDSSKGHFQSKESKGGKEPPYVRFSNILDHFRKQVRSIINDEKKVKKYLLKNEDKTILLGSKEKDELKGDSKHITLIGFEGDDTLHGNENNNILFGNSGSDYLFGGKGDDFLCGGKGDDFLSGGPGTDQFIYNVQTTGDATHSTKTRSHYLLYFLYKPQGTDTLVDFNLEEDYIFIKGCHWHWDFIVNHDDKSTTLVLPYDIGNIVIKGYTDPEKLKDSIYCGEESNFSGGALGEEVAWAMCSLS